MDEFAGMSPREKVFYACNELHQQTGRIPSNADIISFLGGSSGATVQKYKTLWIQDKKSKDDAMRGTGAAQKELYESFRGLCETIQHHSDQRFASERSALESRVDAAESNFAAASQEIQGLTAALHSERELLSQLQGRIADLQRMLDSMNIERQQALEKLADLQAELSDRVNQSVRELESVREEAANRQSALEVHIQEEKRYLAQQQDELKRECQKKLFDAQSMIEKQQNDWKRQCTELTQRVATLTTALRQSEDDLLRLSTELKIEGSTRRALAEKLDQAQRQHDAILAARDRDIRRIENELARVKRLYRAVLKAPANSL